MEHHPEPFEEAIEETIDAVVEFATEHGAEMGHHGQAELTGLAAVALVALLCGLAMSRFRQPAIVGYILAGVVLGPSALGLVEDRNQIAILAELGVLLLLFVIGMELSLRAFKVVWVTAVGTALAQIGASVGVMMLAHVVFGLDFAVAILLGFVIAISSTAVAVKILDQTDELRTRVGRIAVGVLIAQDLAVVPMMLIVAGLGGAETSVVLTVAQIVFAVGLLILLILYLSRRHRVRLPFTHLVAGNLDLTAVSGLAFCFGAAAISGAVGLSPAYGAFLAGLVIGNSTERKAMMETVEPIQSVLLMIFFVSIGLLMDLSYIWENLGIVLLLWFLASIFKTVLNIGILRAFGESWPRAFLASMAIAQVGEFSFIITQTGLSAQVIDDEIHKLILSVTVLSLAISPIWIVGVRRVHRIALRSFSSIRFVLLLLAGRETRNLLRHLGHSIRRAKVSFSLWRRRRKKTDKPTPNATTTAVANDRPDA